MLDKESAVAALSQYTTALDFKSSSPRCDWCADFQIQFKGSYSKSALTVQSHFQRLKFNEGRILVPLLLHTQMK